ncbi:MAG: 4'-phosphopantetheinyl transferase superfamily protein [Bdellovibrionales bacterium]|nr:4'-phosphopantetheinyl transferase superfamily protein [Bdellovibrionales bacterium]
MILPGLPSSISCETATPDCSHDILLTEEISLAEKISSISRKQQFFIGRVAAHLAIKKLGLETNIPILRTDNKTPLWPSNILGSISHTDTLALAAVAKKEKMLTIGVDIEALYKADISLCNRIATENEKTCADNNPEKILQLFSAKEAIYKAVSPISSVTPGFKDVELAVTGDSIQVTAIAGRGLEIKALLESLSILCFKKDDHIMSFCWKEN